MFRLAKRGNVRGLGLLFESCRARVLVDINQTYPGTGDSVLHIAAKADNKELVMAILDLGGDPYLKNKRGKTPHDLARSEPVKAILRNTGIVPLTSSVSDASLRGTSVTQTTPQQLSHAIPAGRNRVEGYLSKWTNYAEGYKRRWFVLEDTQLGYYKSQAEYPVTCRGSMNIAFIRTVPHNQDRCRFDIIGVASCSVRMHLRAETPQEARRWIFAINHQRSVIKEQTSTQGLATENEPEGGAVQSIRPIDLILASRQRTSIRPSVTATGSEVRIKDALQQLELQEAIMGNLCEEIVDTNSNGNLGNGGDSNNGHGSPSSIEDQFKLCQEVIDSVRECLVFCQDRETWWQERLDAEIRQRQIFEDSLRALALENTRMEHWMRHQKNSQTAPITSPTSDDDEQFYDVIEEEEEPSPTYRGDRVPSPGASFLGPVSTMDPWIQQDMAGYEELFQNGFRETLPVDASQMPPISLWNILKNAVGKDLARIPIPVNFLEPISMVQRLAEDMEYARLLNEAANCRNDPVKRLILVATFAVSGYASTEGRVTKPFNSLLGETFEYLSAQDGYRLLVEQVSHHPPISAIHADSSKWTYMSEVKIKNKFWGKSMELIPEGISHVFFHNYQNEKHTPEHYSWKKVTSIVHNIIVGKMWIDHYGTMEVKCHQTGLILKLQFHPTGWRTVKPKLVDGDLQGHHIEGYWSSHLDLKRNDESTLRLWERTSPSASKYLYHFGPFSMSLNQMTLALKARICPTDSRNRPDQRAMEQGHFDQANNFKCQLEEQQRVMLRLVSESAIIEPRWFRLSTDSDTGEPCWRYIGGYWESRRSGTWNEVPNLFSIDADDIESASN